MGNMGQQEPEILDYTNGVLDITGCQAKIVQGNRTLALLYNDPNSIFMDAHYSLEQVEAVYRLSKKWFNE